MWGYGGDLTYDFAAATAAWGLGLAEVKSLVRNSVTCSTLRGKDQAAALAAVRLAMAAGLKPALP